MIKSQHNLSFFTQGTLLMRCIFSFILLLAYIMSHPLFATSMETTAQTTAWIQHIQQNLPQKLCDQQFYFRQCFTIQAFECKTIIKHIVQDCLKNIETELPKILTIENGKYWGGIIGECTYNKYETFMSHARKTDCPMPNQTIKAEKTKPVGVPPSGKKP